MTETRLTSKRRVTGDVVVAQEAKEGLPWDTGKETGASLHAALPRVPRRDRGAKTTTKTMVTAAEAAADAAATAGQRSDDREVDNACVDDDDSPRRQ